MEMTKEKIIQMWNILSEIGNEKTNVKFSYAIARNLNIIEPEVKALTKAQEISKEYKEYDAKRLEICREMAKKDEDGNPIMKDGVGNPIPKGGEFDIEDRPTFDKKIEKLQKKNKEAIDMQKNRIEQFNDLIKETIEIDFYSVKIEHVPDDIKPNHLALMMGFIEGEPTDE